MFTIPVGNFKRVATGYRPSANSVSTTPIGSVSDVTNAYDSDPSTYSYASSSTGTTETIYSGFTSVVASSAILDMNIFAVVNGAVSPNITIDISYNGGSSYDFSVPITWYPFGPNVWVTSGIDRDVLWAIPDNINLASVKIKVKTGVSTSAGSIMIYDIVINQ